MRLEALGWSKERLHLPEVEVILVMATFYPGQGDVGGYCRVVCPGTIFYQEPNRNRMRKENCSKQNSQEEFLFALLALDAVSCCEPLARHVDHRDLRLVLAILNKTSSPNDISAYLQKTCSN